MNPTIKIGNRHIGQDHPPLVIAELGINHNGDIHTAYAIVKSAKEAGAEIIKHQTHIIDDEMSHHAKSMIPGNTDMSIYEVMNRCALNKEEERSLKNYVEELGMLFISTPFSRAAANFLEELNVPAYKIGSGECNNYPLLEHIAQFGKPIILSTGMNSLSSIEKSVAILRKNNVPYALLHCTNVYPTPHHLVRLGALTQLKNRFPDAVIGLSDHTEDNYACLGAVALGASILERHYTDTKTRNGPDIICSMDQYELKDLLHGAKSIALARGGEKGFIAEERVTADFAFASVVSIRAIKQGELFSHDNLWVKRPGNGDLSADELNNILGKEATRDIAIDSQLKKSDVGW